MAALASAGLAWQAAAQLPFLSDDALISLRYAARLLDGHGLTWTPGPPVEGYSNLLWVLLVAAAGALGADLVDAARLLGVAGMLAVVGAIATVYGRGQRPGEGLGAAVGLAFFVTAAPTAVWAVGGLEQPLVAALLAGVLALYRTPGAGVRRLVGISALLGALCLARPDGPLFAAAVLAAMAASRWTGGRAWSWHAAAVVAAGPAACVLGQLAFRLAVYEALVPNTALVKLTPSSHHALAGLRYVAGGALSLAPASVFAAAAVGVGLTRTDARGFAFVLAATGVLWSAYVVAIGGDVFPAHRHLVPLVVVAAFALAEGTAFACARRRWPAGIALAAIAVTAATQPVWPANEEARIERWEWQARSLALTLRAALAGRDPLLGVTAAGALPYWTEFRSVDLLGLNDPVLPHLPVPDAGLGFLGHELGDVGYLLRRAPDVVVFTAGVEPVFRYERQVPGNRTFEAAYARMRLRTAVPPVYDALVFFRRESAALGAERTPARVRVPAVALDGHAATEARLRGGRLVVSVAPGQPAGGVVRGLRGAWRARAETVSGRASAEASTEGDGVRVEVTGTADVEAVVLTRAP